MHSKAKVLVVDDNPAILELLNETLAEHGYEVTTSCDGVDAIQKISDISPDIVITDIVMPGIDGIELLLSLRKDTPEIKIIAMSGGNRGHADTYLHMAEKLGANAIINKPFEISELLGKLKVL